MVEEDHLGRRACDGTDGIRFWCWFRLALVTLGLTLDVHCYLQAQKKAQNNK